MICQDFLARHSEFVDGEMHPQEAARWREHLADCAACARYDRVVRQGASLVRGLPEVEPSFDFFPRLQHRIYNLEDGLRSRRDASTTGAAVSLAIAAALALLAWTPLLRSGIGPGPTGGSVAGSTVAEHTLDVDAGDASAGTAGESVQLAAEGAVHAPAPDDNVGHIDRHAPSAVSWYGFAANADASWRLRREAAGWLAAGGYEAGDVMDEWSRRAASWITGAEPLVEARGWSGRAQGAAWPVAGAALPALASPDSRMYRARVLDVPPSGMGHPAPRRFDPFANPE